MGVSGGDTRLLGRNDRGIAEYGDPANRKQPSMKTTIKYITPWLAAAAVSGAIGLAPVALADTGTTPVKVAAPAPAPAPAPTPFGSGPDPLVPSGVNPYVPYVLGAPFRDPAGGVDLPS
jgi:hypothetical protein